MSVASLKFNLAFYCYPTARTDCHLEEGIQAVPPTLQSAIDERLDKSLDLSVKHSISSAAILASQKRFNLTLNVENKSLSQKANGLCVMTLRQSQPLNDCPAFNLNI